MPADERIRVIFRHVDVLRDADTFGSGEWYFIASVDGRSVGDRNQIFDAYENRSINLPQPQWSIEIDVTGRDLNANPVRVRFQVMDSDVTFDDDLGTVEYQLRRNVSQGNFRTFRTRNRYYILHWRVELSVLGRFGLHPPDAVFATRQHSGNVSCTTVSGGSFMARMEICPVRPTPPDASLPPRPALSAAAAAIASERNDAPINITPASPINIIPNPSAIPILTPAEANAQSAARIEFSYYHPETLRFTDVDPRLEWTAVPISGGAVQFLPPARGRKVMVYGTAEGEVRLEVRFQGALFATYRALVLPVRQIRYRANILNGPNTASQPRSTPDNVRDHIAIANRFLRHMAIELVPDDNATVTHGATATAHRGIFRIRVAAGVTRNIGVTGWPRATRLNYRQGVFNFAYIHSDRDGNLGAATDYPANGAGNSITDNGTPSTSWILPSGIPPDGAAGTVTMNLIDARERNTATYPRLYAMYVTNANGDPANANDQMTYAGTIAHELGHVLNLGHRVEGPDASQPTGFVANGIFFDGLTTPSDENLMHWSNPTNLA
ncbi:MAG: hypothetical protein AB1457_18425, partial [Chloroflexota bacterium]